MATIPHQIERPVQAAPPAPQSWPAGGRPVPVAVAATPPLSVVTRMTFAVPPAVAWKGLLFYEDLDQRPPLYLRWLLPIPVRTEGMGMEVGDEVRCWYEQGYLRKRISRLEHGTSYEFDVIEQALRFRGDLRLSGGRYSLRELVNGLTEIAVETRYRSDRRPRWFWYPLERLVCHAFHRHLLRSIRRKVEAG